MTMLRATLAEAMKGKRRAIESRRKALAADARGDRRPGARS
jgi:hypothetical protein